MKTIIELYEKYEDSDFSMIIKNNDFDMETVELLFILPKYSNHQSLNRQICMQLPSALSILHYHIR